MYACCSRFMNYIFYARCSYQVLWNALSFGHVLLKWPRKHAAELCLSRVGDRCPVRALHVSQERSSCLRLVLNLWVSLKSCRFLCGLPLFFLFCLALTQKGAGGFIALFAVYSSAHGWPLVNSWTCEGPQKKIYMIELWLDILLDTQPFKTITRLC